MYQNAPPKEGDLYKKIEIDGHVFELRFGYYEEFERESGEPVVIYPDLATHALYTKDGRRLVTVIQDPCEHYIVPEGRARDECCNDCQYCVIEGDDIGVCSHRAMRRERGASSD